MGCKPEHYESKEMARKTLILRMCTGQQRNRRADGPVKVVRETMQPTHVAVWLRPDTPSRKDDVSG